MSVLLVEDEPRIAEFLVKGLTACGYQVEHVGTGTLALASARAHAYDLVLLDLGLPDIDGLDMIRRLRAAGRTPPVIVLTGRASDRDAGLRLGANRLLVKPQPFWRLLEHVRELLAETAGPVRASEPAIRHCARPESQP